MLCSQSLPYLLYLDTWMGRELCPHFSDEVVVFGSVLVPDVPPCLHLHPYPSFLATQCLQSLHVPWFHSSSCASANLLFPGNVLMVGSDGSLEDGV